MKILGVIVNNKLSGDETLKLLSRISINKCNCYGPGTPKQFDSAGEIQVWKNAFFGFLILIPLPHGKNKFNIFFLQFCLLKWVTATNQHFVCLTESLQQTKKIPSHCDKQNLYMLLKCCQKCQQCSICWHFCALFGTFWDYLGTLLLFFL